MKIVQSQVHLAGQHQRERVALNSQRQVVEGGSDSENDRSSLSVSLSRQFDETKSLKSHSNILSLQNGSGAQFINEAVLRTAAEYVLQQQVEIDNPRAASTSRMLTANNLWLELDQIFTLEEQETLSFEALGKVMTDDGREVDFMLSFEFERSLSTEHHTSFRGNRALIDPLMINFEGNTIEFSDMTFDFDLDSDGDHEQLAQTATGSGYLVLDKNQNGEIDNGGEMFGPQSGQGFAELAQYDDDGNGWIDENDAVFQQLQIMTFENGEAHNISLAEAGVGAFYLGNTSSDYQLRDDNGQLLGSIRGSGVALSEQGEALMFQQIDMADMSQEETLIRQQNGLFQINPPMTISMTDNELPIGVNQQLSDIDVSGIRLAASFSFSQEISNEYFLNIRQPVNNQARENVRDWVNQVMFGRSESSTESNRERASAQATDVTTAQQANNPFMDSEKLQQQQTDARLLRLRSMVEELKSLQQEERTNAWSQDNKAAGYYRKVENYQSD